MTLFRDVPNLKEIFTDIYTAKGFGGVESVSGPGSDLASTHTLRVELDLLLREYQVLTLSDAPCGDYNWMQHVGYGIGWYSGYDIVGKLIEDNNRLYANDRVSFWYADVTKDILPKADLILCRDCFVHLPFKEILKAVKLFKASGSKYLLTTTFVDRDHNVEISAGQWRTVNMTRWPLFFPEPLAVLNEQCPENGGEYRDKSLGLWELDSIWP